MRAARLCVAVLASAGTAAALSPPPSTHHLTEYGVDALVENVSAMRRLLTQINGQIKKSAEHRQKFKEAIATISGGSHKAPIEGAELVNPVVSPPPATAEQMAAIARSVGAAEAATASDTLAAAALKLREVEAQHRAALQNAADLAAQVARLKRSCAGEDLLPSPSPSPMPSPSPAALCPGSMTQPLREAMKALDDCEKAQSRRRTRHAPSLTHIDSNLSRRPRLRRRCTRSRRSSTSDNSSCETCAPRRLTRARSRRRICSSVAARSDTPRPSAMP